VDGCARKPGSCTDTLTFVAASTAGVGKRPVPIGSFGDLLRNIAWQPFQQSCSRSSSLPSGCFSRSNYHVRALATVGLAERVETLQRRNLLELRFRAVLDVRFS